MIKELVKHFRQVRQETAHQLELRRQKHHYHEFLKERLYQMYAARQNENLLLSNLADPATTLAFDHLDQAGQTARTLSRFGQVSLLFDDTGYRQFLGDHHEAASDLTATQLLLEKLLNEGVQKASDNRLTPQDIRLFAIVNYHLESLTWVGSGICPVIDSPYRQQPPPETRPKTHYGV